MKISDVISRLETWHGPVDRPEQTCDRVLFGDGAAECRGVAVTCFASAEVVRAAAARGCNLIICHEPLFFEGNDDTAPLEGNTVLAAKRRLLAETGMTVWRDHDHMHGPGGLESAVHPQTDWIYCGIMKELGWEQYAFGERTKPLWFRLPETTGRALAGELLEKLNLTGLRVVGDADARVSTVFLCEHVGLFPGRDSGIIRSAERADALIPLEINDWTLSEYVRDACALGAPKVILEPGHFNLEELGMKYMAETWLPELLGNAAPVRFLASGDSFRYIAR